MAGPVFIAPSTRTFLNLSRELVVGTPTTATPSATMPLDQNDYNPEDTPKFLADEAIRGVMTPLFNEIRGVQNAQFSLGGPVFLDIEGFMLDNTFGDVSTTANGTLGTAPTIGSAIAVGATQVTASSSIGSPTTGSVIQISDGAASEVVLATSGSTGTSINFTNTPTRFAHSTSATVALQSASGGYCVDEETEILTATGWKTVHDLHEGDEVLTYNHETGMSEWQAALEVCVFPAEPREMIRMEGRGHSSLTTPNHRWPVITRSGLRKWKTTETLTSSCTIPVGAMCADLPSEAKYTDALVEVVAWFWTEGHTPTLNTARIYQSLKNAENVDRIDAALRGVFGAPQTGNLVRNTPKPIWRRHVESRGKNVIFSLNASAGKILREFVPDRLVKREWLRTLTQAQLDLFIKVSMLADNCGPTRLGQKERERAELFQFAAILAGYPTSLLDRVYKRDGYRMWQVTLWRKRTFNMVNAMEAGRRKPAGDGPGRFTIERVQHSGVIWCPRTPNMTWYARRNGTCYFTGNTHKFAILNTGNGQPPTHSMTDYTGLTTSVGARTYPSFCVGQLDFSGNTEQLLMRKISGESWQSSAAGTTPTAATSFVLPQANWRSTVSIGGTPINDIGNWACSIKRKLQTYWTATNTQTPYIIARGGLTMTYTFDWTVAENENALTEMLTSGYLAVVITLDNGLSSTNRLNITITSTTAQAVKSKPERTAVLVGYGNTMEAVANSTDAGGSGGQGPGTVSIINNTPAY
jgi:hypothetical protein